MNRCRALGVDSLLAFFFSDSGLVITVGLSVNGCSL